MHLLAVIGMRLLMILYTCYLSNPNYGKSIWRRFCVPDRDCYEHKSTSLTCVM